jgi:hypothetical protein
MRDFEELGYSWQLQSVGTITEAIWDLGNNTSKRILYDGLMDIVATEWITSEFV